ncbi:MAG: putative nudix hydrolase [Alphaproteobacteria bacterium]|jgi:8-oxo-dGTP pyrophosphatase MutT (NUDIX family)|nr:putative nudix hydrolase [Alphaproteobacteria bacterium]MDF3033139.1 putative nudix hydrolase [Alphaproteobacteria bacterium]
MNFISLCPPDGFGPSIEVAGCYCEYEDKVLFLKRSPHKLHGKTWNLPGGKLNEGETPRTAVVREVFEEAGIGVKEEDLEEVNKFYVRSMQTDFIFYTFRAQFLTLPTLNLRREEHEEAAWLTLEEALKLPLIYGGVEVLLNYKEYIRGR